MCVTWLIHVRDMTNSYLWHDPSIRVTWVIHMCGMTDSCVTWLIHVCDMTHSYVWHDSFMCVICLTYMPWRFRVQHLVLYICDMTHLYVWHESFIRVTRPFHIWDMTHSFVCVTWLTDMTWRFQVPPLVLQTCISMRAVPIRIPNRKQKQSWLCGMFCRMFFIPNHFNRNRNRNRVVPVILEFVTICDICDQNVTKSGLLKKLKKPERVTEVPNSKLWHFVTVTNVTHGVWPVHNLFLFLFGIRIGAALCHVTRMSHVTHMDESCHTCEWVMPHVRMSHVTNINGPRHTRESRLAYDEVIQRIRMSHGTLTNESCHTYIDFESHL